MTIQQADTETIWQELNDSLKEFIRRRVRDERDVEDILQDVFFKIHNNCLTQKEMGEQLGISVSGAKSRVQRARRELKNTLLDCCHFEFSHMGKMLDYQPRHNDCAPGCDGACQE